MLKAVAPTDGYDEYSFEEPGEHSMKFPPMRTNDKDTRLTIRKDNITQREWAVVPCESAEPPKHDDECSTLTSVVRKSACARLAMESLCAVSRCYTCGREHA